MANGLKKNLSVVVLFRQILLNLRYIYANDKNIIA